MMFLTMSGVRASSMSKGSQQRVCMLPKAVILYSPMSVPKTLFCRNQLACLHKRTKIRRRSAQGTRSIEKQFQVVQQQLATSCDNLRRERKEDNSCWLDMAIDASEETFSEMEPQAGFSAPPCLRNVTDVKFQELVAGWQAGASAPDCPSQPRPAVLFLRAASGAKGKSTLASTSKGNCQPRRPGSRQIAPFPPPDKGTAQITA